MKDIHYCISLSNSNLPVLNYLIRDNLNLGSDYGTALWELYLKIILKYY